MRLRGWRKAAFYAICVLLLVWTVFPVYYMIMLSLVTWEDLFKPRLRTGADRPGVPRAQPAARR